MSTKLTQQPKANLPTPLIPQYVLGPLHQRPHNRRQNRHRHNIQHNPHWFPIRLARLKRQLRERRPDHRRLIALPLLGTGSNALIRWRAKRNGGLHEPDTRIIPLILPVIIGAFTSVLYGQGTAHLEQYHWFVYVWTVAAYYFCFVGANIVAIKYLLDSYPARAGPLLVTIVRFGGLSRLGRVMGRRLLWAIWDMMGRLGFLGPS